MEFVARGMAVLAPRTGPAASACVSARPPISALPISSPISALPARSASSCSALSRLDAVPYAAFSCEEYVDLLILVTSYVPEK